MNKAPPPISTTDQIVAQAITHLNRGGCIGLPTETVYGLAARFDRADAIESIFRLKERPLFDPLIVHVASLEQAQSLTTSWPPLAQALAEKFWPGPLTLVLPKSPALNPMISSGLETVGLRMPSHPLALEIIKQTAPLAAPSANRFGRTSPTHASHVVDEFPEAVARGEILVVDGGPCAVGLESTVCQVLNGELKILRPGAVTEAILHAWNPHLKITRAQKPNEALASPGHLEHHYMPKKPLAIGWNKKFHEISAEEWCMAGITDLMQVTQVIQMQLPEDPALAARMLYAELRRCDDETGTLIFLYRAIAQKEGLWEAIDDRLKRAARHQLGTAPSHGPIREKNQ